MYMVSMDGSSFLFIKAIVSSNSKSDTARRPLMTTCAPQARTYRPKALRNDQPAHWGGDGHKQPSTSPTFLPGRTYVFSLVFQDCDNNIIKDRCCTRYNVKVSHSYRIETAWAYCKGQQLSLRREHIETDFGISVALLPHHCHP